MIDTIENFVSDILKELTSDTAIQVLASDTSVGLLMFPLKFYLNKKMEEKRDILIEEIRNGGLGLDNSDKDDFVTSVCRIHMAIFQGAGITNIRLLAKLLVGMEKNSIHVYADQFLRYAGMLESLSVEEIQILGIFSRKLKECLSTEELNQKWDDNVYSKLSDVSRKTHQEFTNSGLGTNQDFVAYNAAISRTGLLIPEILVNGMSFYPSPLFVKLIEIIEVDIDKVLE